MLWAVITVKGKFLSPASPDADGNRGGFCLPDECIWLHYFFIGKVIIQKYGGENRYTSVAQKVENEGSRDRRLLKVLFFTIALSVLFTLSSLF